MELKYVRHSRVGFILWPKTDALYHAHVGKLLSAVTRGRSCLLGLPGWEGVLCPAMGCRRALASGQRREILRHLLSSSI